MPTAAARCRSRPRAGTGPAAPRRRPATMPRARAHFERAAATPELFYGQLALERLGRIVPAPSGTPSLLVTPAQRTGFLPEAAGPGASPARIAGPLGRAEPVRPRLVRRCEQRSRTAAGGRAGEPVRPSRPGGMDRPLGAQRRLGLLLQGDLSRPTPTACPRAASGRWSTASPARNRASTSARSATPARAA